MAHPEVAGRHHGRAAGGGAVHATRDARTTLPWHGGEVVASREAAEHYVGLVCFKIGPPTLVGVELEWLVHDAHDPTAPISAARLAAALGDWRPPYLHPEEPTPHPGTYDQQHNAQPDAPQPGSQLPGQRRSGPRDPAPARPDAPRRTPNGSGRLLPRGSAVTVEPGGQVEISSRPAATLADCLADVAGDEQTIRTALAAAGLTTSGHGIDPYRRPARLLDLPRYAAMESYFDRSGAAGRTMMCSTAAVQVCLDAGTENGSRPDGLAARWHALHALGPVLVAMFANSPVHAGAATGWRSSRQLAWAGIDPARTAAPASAGTEASGTDPRAAYARYALDAPLLCIRRDGGQWEAPPGVTFADWIAGALTPPPTFADLDYHLSTLFPPVRPQGHLEVRYLDAQPGGGWVVPTALLWALCGHAPAMDAALAAAEPVNGAWQRAARRGFDDPELVAAAEGVLAAALDGMVPASVPAEAQQAVNAFAERYTLRGRSPADDWITANGAVRPAEHQEEKP